MTTITGLVRTLKANAAPGSQLRWKYMSAPALVNNQLVSSYEDIVTVCNSIGEFSQALTAGNYELTIDGNSADKWRVLVPGDDLSYDVSDNGIIVSAFTALPTAPSASAVPNATTSTYGKVKLTKDGANPKVATGIWVVTNVAALKAIASDASHSFALLTAPAAGEPRIAYYDPSSAAADDPTGFTVMKPTDNPSTGRWIPFSY
jgi:hypothetical protein